MYLCLYAILRYVCNVCLEPRKRNEFEIFAKREMISDRCAPPGCLCMYKYFYLMRDYLFFIYLYTSLST